MNLINDKIKFYTNIILSGAISFTPVLWHLHQLRIIEQSLFLTLSAISILFVGRICLEIALLVEDSWIDTIVACRVRKHHHYENIKDEGNVFYDNWNKYLLLNNNEFAHKIIAHLADRLLFLLSTSIASIICSILLVLIFKYSILPFLGLFIFVIVYVIFSFTRAISIAAGLDFLRHFILENQRNPVEQEEDALV
jgi:hypothetical protein